MRQKPDVENCCIFQRKVAMTATAAAEAAAAADSHSVGAADSAAVDVNDGLSGRASTVSPQTLTYIYFYYLRRLRLATAAIAAAGSAMSHGPWAAAACAKARAYLGRLIFNSLNRLADRSGQAKAVEWGRGGGGRRLRHEACVLRVPLLVILA